MNFGIFYNISRQLRRISVRQFDFRCNPLNCCYRFRVSNIKHNSKCEEEPKFQRYVIKTSDKSHQYDEEKRKNFWQRFYAIFYISAGLTASHAFSLFSWFDWGKKEEQTPEMKLIEAIKRSVLCIQREQFDKAEQMLHLALRMAQDIQSNEGIIYIFDVMANLAMEREQYTKAEKLFADVMRRLLSEGHTEFSPQVLHISSKLAHMAQLQGELEKSNLGFVWTLKGIQKSMEQLPNNRDVQELFGLTKNWFGQLQLKQAKYEDAKKNFLEAFDVLVELHGKANEEAIIILNNLSVTCVHLEDYSGAKHYILQALDIAQELKDTAQQGILQANLGLIYLREGLLSQAKQTCSYAYRIGKKYNNDDAIEQAEYCLNEIKATVTGEV